MCRKTFTTYFSCTAAHDHTHVCKEYIDHTWKQKDTLPCPNTDVAFIKKFSSCTCADHPERVCKTRLPGRANDKGHTYTFDFVGKKLKKREREDKKKEAFEQAQKELYEQFYGPNGEYGGGEGAQTSKGNKNVIDFEVAVDEVIGDIGGMEVDDDGSDHGGEETEEEEDENEDSTKSVTDDQLFPNNSDDERRSRFKKRRTDRDYSIPQVDAEVKKFLDTSPKKSRASLAEDNDDDMTDSDDSADLDYGAPADGLNVRKHAERATRAKRGGLGGNGFGTRKYPSSEF